MRPIIVSLLAAVCFAGCASNDEPRQQFTLIWRETSGTPIEKVQTPEGFMVSPATAVKGIMGIYSRLPSAEFYLFVDSTTYYFGNTRKGTGPLPRNRATTSLTA
jgi:hypothetical protein